MAVVAGVLAGLVSLIGFGVDSGIESASAVLVGIRLAARLTTWRSRRGEGAPRSSWSRVTFFVLAAYVTIEGIRSLIAGEASDTCSRRHRPARVIVHRDAAAGGRKDQGRQGSPSRTRSILADAAETPNLHIAQHSRRWPDFVLYAKTGCRPGSTPSRASSSPCSPSTRAAKPGRAKSARRPPRSTMFSITLHKVSWVHAFTGATGVKGGLTRAAGGITERLPSTCRLVMSSLPGGGPWNSQRSAVSGGNWLSSRQQSPSAGWSRPFRQRLQAAPRSWRPRTTSSRASAGSPFRGSSSPTPATFVRFRLTAQATAANFANGHKIAFVRANCEVFDNTSSLRSVSTRRRIGEASTSPSCSASITYRRTRCAAMPSTSSRTGRSGRRRWSASEQGHQSLRIRWPSTGVIPCAVTRASSKPCVHGSPQHVD